MYFETWDKFVATYLASDDNRKKIVQSDTFFNFVQNQILKHKLERKYTATLCSLMIDRFLEVISEQELNEYLRKYVTTDDFRYHDLHIEINSYCLSINQAVEHYATQAHIPDPAPPIDAEGFLLVEGNEPQQSIEDTTSQIPRTTNEPLEKVRTMQHDIDAMSDETDERKDNAASSWNHFDAQIPDAATVEASMAEEEPANATSAGRVNIGVPNYANDPVVNGLSQEDLLRRDRK